MVQRIRLVFGLCCLALPATAVMSAFAQERAIGQVKTMEGVVSIERGGASRTANVGDSLTQSDVLRTGARSSVGVTFRDSSMLSLGPDTVLSLDSFQFDDTTHEGAFESSLRKGTLAVKSGQIVRQTPGAMKVKTPLGILGVRGTEFVVRASE